MTEQYRPIAELLDRVRARWRSLVALQALARTAVAATITIAFLVLSARWMSGAPAALAVLGGGGAVLVLVVLAWGLRAVRKVPTDALMARFIEERSPGLDQRLISAVDVETAVDPGSRPAFAPFMIADAARAASVVDPAAIVPVEALRGAAFKAAAAVLVLGLGCFVARDVARQSFDALALTLFPSRIVLEVTPGRARVQAGSGLTIAARLVGNRAPVTAQLLRADADVDNWRAVDMDRDADGRFSVAVNGLTAPFRYRVVAGAVSSETFDVTVVRAPRVTRIDVEYIFPKALGLAPRVEEDGGDIYAPGGTSVQVVVHTDLPAASGRMVLGGGQPILLQASGGGPLRGALEIVQDDTYRVALADAEGMTSRGDTEYFIRMIEDRPPEARIVSPASDRRVTALEEVEIVAEAQDDYGIGSLDLIYSVAGGDEHVLPLGVPGRQTSVTGRRTLYLEDLNVRPGDFISYYVRARDLARGKRASEARSDIFFLDVKPFEEEFMLAQGQSSMGAGEPGEQIDDLVAAQKEIIVATWKLDRRSRVARGAQSEQDIKAVSRAQGELKARATQVSSTFRESAMRDPRARGGSRPGVRAGQTLPEENAMVAAGAAMGRAVTALDALKTAEAVVPEMEALNHLLKAQADTKKRQQISQQAGNGRGGNRSSQDLSSLFDKELARQQQTNYETPASAEGRDDREASALDQIKELARRQDELLKRQQELARQGSLSAEETKRELEKLTRDQNDLRQRAEELAQQMGKDSASQPSSSSGNSQRQAEQPNASGQRSQSGQQQNQPGPQGGQQGQSGSPSSASQPTRSAQAGSDGGRQMREITDEMRGAASDLRRQDPGQASERSARVLDRLRDLEQQLQSNTPDGRRRALGDLQLETRQIADAQRQIAGESSRPGSGDGGADALRRLAGAQERLASRLRRVQESLKQQGGAPASGGGQGSTDARAMQQAADDAARDMERQRLAERMEESARALRSAAGAPGGTGATAPQGGRTASPSGRAQTQEEIARALDRLADRLTPPTGGGDDESRRLSGQMARVQELRNRIDELTRQLDQMAQQGTDGQSARGQSAGAQAGQGASEGATAADAERLAGAITQELRGVRELLNDAQRDLNSGGAGAAGFTYEAPGSMVLSAPGTEAFKQDFSKWEEMRRQATLALEQLESTLAGKLQDKVSQDRLAAGSDDKAPAAYQQQVDSYFKALATKQKR